MSLHDTDRDGSEQEEAQKQGLRSTRGLSEVGSAPREVRVDSKGEPDARSEEDKKPLEYVTFSENIFEAMLATPYCADRVGNEVDGQWGSDDDRYSDGVELCELTLEDGDTGGEEEGVDGENL